MIYVLLGFPDDTDGLEFASWARKRKFIWDPDDEDIDFLSLNSDKLPVEFVGIVDQHFE